MIGNKLFVGIPNLMASTPFERDSQIRRFRNPVRVSSNSCEISGLLNQNEGQRKSFSGLPASQEFKQDFIGPIERGRGNAFALWCLTEKTVAPRRNGFLSRGELNLEKVM